jgi:hypothetical protein
VNCLKLKKNANLNINCEDLLMEGNLEEVSLLQMNSKKVKDFKEEKKEEGFLDNSRNDLQGEEEEKIQKIEKLEQMVNNLTGEIKVMTDELSLLKESVSKKQKSPKEEKTAKNNDNNINNEKNLLKMKTFSDLQLDLKSLNLKPREEKKDSLNDDFLQKFMNNMNKMKQQQ